MAQAPPLRRIHPDSVYQTGAAKLALEYWRGRPTDEIVQSLQPGAAEALRVKADGRVLNGNTRLIVLEERGYDGNGLPREVIP
jgi:hypothetical protein